MPTYEFKCISCGYEEEIKAGMNDSVPIPYCPTCDAIMNRVWSGISTHIKQENMKDWHQYKQEVSEKESKWDNRFLDLAEVVASWSKDPSTKTGAVIVRPDLSVASVGFNGFPKGMPDSPEAYHNREEKYSRIVHCEVNAQIHAHGPVDGYTLYTIPFMSCDRCAIQMLQAGIARFVFPRASDEALDRWSESFAKTIRYFEECGVEYTEIVR